MAEAPYKVIDKRSSTGYTGSSNFLYRGARQNTDRRYVYPLDKDFHRNLNNYGRKTLMTLGRWLYANFDIVSGAIDEMANYSVSTFLPQYCGQNVAWGREAENWMMEHDKICDMAGWPYNMELFRKNLISSVLRDGDMGVLQTQTPEGYPMLQSILAHRIGSGPDEAIVTEGRWDGARIIQGVIVDDYSRPLAYRVLDETDSYAASPGYRDIAASEMSLHFIPDYPGQVRGISRLGKSVFNWQDVQETRSFEVLAQKMASVRGFKIKNETGEPEDAAMLALSINPNGATPPPSQPLPPMVQTDVVDGVNHFYLKAGSGSDIEPINFDRPSANQQAFEDRIIRGALAGMGWSFDMYDPSKVGGASMRVVIEKVNRSISQLQKFVAIPFSRRIDGWRVSKAVKLGFLTPDVDWYKWTYQGPAKLTADAKYQSDVNIQEMRAGVKTPQQVIEEGGGYWEDVQDDAIAFEKRFQERCKAEGVDPNRVILLTPNGNPPAADTNAARLADESKNDQAAGRT